MRDKKINTRKMSLNLNTEERNERKTKKKDVNEE